MRCSAFTSQGQRSACRPRSSSCTDRCPTSAGPLSCEHRLGGPAACGQGRARAAARPAGARPPGTLRCQDAGVVPQGQILRATGGCDRRAATPPRLLPRNWERLASGSAPRRRSRFLFEAQLRVLVRLSDAIAVAEWARRFRRSRNSVAGFRRRSRPVQPGAAVEGASAVHAPARVLPRVAGTADGSPASAQSESGRALKCHLPVRGPCR